MIQDDAYSFAVKQLKKPAWHAEPWPPGLLIDIAHWQGSSSKTNGNGAGCSLSLRVMATSSGRGFSLGLLLTGR
jgi:hypothetical protein